MHQNISKKEKRALQASKRAAFFDWHKRQITRRDIRLAEDARDYAAL